MKTVLLLLSFVALVPLPAFAQSKKGTLYFERPSFTDSPATLMIPVQYNEPLFTSDKLAAWGGTFANIIFYDVATDRSHRLFDHDTYIERFGRMNFYSPRDEKYKTAQWLFYQVRDTNTSGDKRISGRDPVSLYASDQRGMNLKRITPSAENVLGFELYEAQGFMMIHMQRDEDGNGRFSANDHDYYYVSLSLKTLKLGNKIEVGREE